MERIAAEVLSEPGDRFNKFILKKEQAPVPLKINFMTFSKSHDIKVMTLVFRPTKQIS